jgi:hypothetical protein
MSNQEIEKKIAEVKEKLTQQTASFDACDEDIAKLLERKKKALELKNKTNEIKTENNFITPEEMIATGVGVIEKQEQEKENRPVSLEDQIAAAKANIKKDINNKADAAIAKSKKEQEDSDKKAENQKDLETENTNTKEKYAENLAKTRTEYANAYKLYVSEKNRRAGKILTSVKKFLGIKINENKLPEEVKNLEKEYNRALVEYGQKLFTDKKAELKNSNLNLSEDKISENLKHFKQVELFDQLIIKENQILISEKTESLPPKEKNLFRKAISWYFSPAKSENKSARVGKKVVKIAISLAITGTVIYFVMPATVVAAGGLASFAAMKGVRATVGAIVGNLGAKGYDKFVKDTIEKRKESEINKLSEQFSEFEKFSPNIYDIESFKKDYSKVLETEKNRKRNRQIHKALVAVGLGAGTSLGMSEIVHALTPEQVLSGHGLSSVHNEHANTRAVTTHDNAPAQETTQPSKPSTNVDQNTNSTATQNQNTPDNTNGTNNTAPKQTSPNETPNDATNKNAGNNTAPTQEKPETEKPTNDNTAPAQTKPETTEPTDNTAPPQTKPEIDKATSENAASTQINPETGKPMNADASSGFKTELRPGEVEENGEVFGSNQKMPTEETFSDGKQNLTEKPLINSTEEVAKTSVQENANLNTTQPSEESAKTFIDREYPEGTKTFGTQPEENIIKDQNVNKQSFIDKEYKEGTTTFDQDVSEESNTQESFIEKNYPEGSKSFNTPEEQVQTGQENQSFIEKEYPEGTKTFGTQPENNIKIDENATPGEAKSPQPEGLESSNKNTSNINQTENQITKEQSQAQIQNQTNQTQTPWEHKLDATGHPVEKLIAEGENPYELNKDQILEINNLYEEKLNKIFPTEGEKYNWQGMENYKGMAASFLNSKDIGQEMTPLDNYVKLRALIQEIHNKTGLQPVENSVLSFNLGTTPKEYIIKGLQYAEKNNIKIKF